MSIQVPVDILMEFFINVPADLLKEIQIRLPDSIRAQLNKQSLDELVATYDLTKFCQFPKPQEVAKWIYKQSLLLQNGGNSIVSEYIYMSGFIEFQFSNPNKIFDVLTIYLCGNGGIMFSGSIDYKLKFTGTEYTLADLIGNKNIYLGINSSNSVLTVVWFMVYNILQARLQRKIFYQINNKIYIDECMMKLLNKTFPDQDNFTKHFLKQVKFRLPAYS